MSSDLDEELDAKVFAPNMRDPDVGLMCFLSIDRPCGADCMAYSNDNARAGSISDQQAHCTLLVGVERLGRFAGGLVSLIRQKTADEARPKSPAPPSPLSKS